MCLRRIVLWLQDCRERDPKRRVQRYAHVPWTDLVGLPDRRVNVTVSKTKHTIDVTTLDDGDDTSACEKVIAGIVVIVDSLMYRTRALGPNMQQRNRAAYAQLTHYWQACKTRLVVDSRLSATHIYPLCREHVARTLEPLVFTVDPDMTLADEASVAALQCAFKSEFEQIVDRP